LQLYFDTMNTKDATFAIYRDREEIKIALQSFRKLGFNNSALWAFQPKPKGSKDFNQVQKYQFKNGALMGAIWGAALVGALFVFIDTEQVGGQLMMITMGVFIGALFGAVAGILVGIGTPDPAAKRYGQYLHSGGILLSVHSENPEQIEQAQQVLAATGGQDIQLIDEFKTWDTANLERIDLEKLQPMELK